MSRHLPTLALALLGATLWVWPVAWTLWSDECFTAGLADRTFAGALHGVEQDRHPPAYFLLVWAAAHLAKSDAALRLVSAAAVFAAWCITTHTARRHLRPAGALAASAWFAGSCVPALFAHTLRPYALALAAGAGLLWGALECIHPDNARARRGAVALAVAGLLAFWSHYAAVLVGVAAFAVALVGAARSGQARSRLPLPLGAGMAVVLGCLPWLLGPFGVQFSERNPRGAVAWEVLNYLFWSPDASVPAWGVVAAGLTTLGVLALAFAPVPPGSRELRRAAPIVGLLMIVLPLFASTNVPARELRNYIGFFPAATLFAGAAIEAALAPVPERLRAAAAVVLSLLVVGPASVQMVQAPTHPQDLEAGHDYRVEAEVLDRLIPSSATVRFQPDYVVKQYDRYVPALGARAVRGPADWQLLTTGGDADACLILYAFRVRVQPPEADCAVTWAALEAEAERTGYPGLLYARAMRAVDEGRAEAAAVDLARLQALPQRWPSTALLAARIAEARGDTTAVEAALTEAVRLARAFEPPGRQTAGLWRKLAAARRKLGDTAGADAAAAASECAAERDPAWACGGPLAWAARPTERRERSTQPAAR